jgi:tetratricopeptide (TPR) repeat protein
MSVRHALYASVCTALLAATAAVSGTAVAASKSNTSLTSQAYQALAAGDTKAAIAAYSEAIEKGKLAPDAMAGALLNRGLAYQQAGDHEKAVEDYSAALRLDSLPSKLRTAALYNRGLSYQKLKQTTLSIDDFTSALFLDSEFSYAYYARGNALRDSGQYLFALSDFEKARRYGYPSAHFAFYGEALTLEQLKRPAEAKAALEKAIALRPDFEAARKKLAALGEAPPAPATVSDANETVTGSLVASAPDQVVRKPEQPAAVAPPAKLLAAVKVDASDATAAGTDEGWSTAEESAPSKKRYTDRILPEEEAPAPKQKIAVAEDKPAADEAQTASTDEAPPEETAAADDTATASISEAESTADTATESTTAEPKGWSVQLSSEREEQAAWNRWSKLKSRHSLLKKKKPVVVKADLGTKGTFYRLRLAGYDNKRAAQSACSRLKSKGISCYVSRAGG